jgi:anti-sigma factor RsiW
MPTCQEVATEVAQDQVPGLPLSKRLVGWMHIAMCRHCRRFWWQMRMMDIGLRTVLNDLEDDMPADLPERTARRLGAGGLPATETATAKPSWQPGWASLATAGLLVGLAGAGLWSIQTQSPERAWNERLLTLAADHEDAAATIAFASNDIDAIQGWLDERLPFAAHVPDIPDTRLEGARLGRLNGRDTATLLYEVDGQEVSFYLTPADASDPTPLAPAQFVGGRGPRSEFLAWNGDGLIHALVGNLPSDRLKGMAQFCLDMANDDVRRFAP